MNLDLLSELTKGQKSEMKPSPLSKVDEGMLMTGQKFEIKPSPSTELTVGNENKTENTSMVLPGSKKESPTP